jgi:hypothetical protein
MRRHSNLSPSIVVRKNSIRRICGAQIFDQANAGARESRDASRPRAARKAEPNRMALRDFCATLLSALGHG